MRQSARWSLALLIVGAVAAVAGAAVWQLSAVVWRWPRADVIAVAAAAVLAVIALGIAPAQWWAAGDSDGSRARGGAEVTRSRAGRNIIARAEEAVRVDRSSAGGDIRASQLPRPLEATVDDGEAASDPPAE